MAAPKPDLLTDHLAFLRALNKHHVRFMIVGMSAARLHGSPLVTEDIDLWIKTFPTRAFLRAVAHVDGIYVPPTAFTPPMLAGGAVSLFDLVLTLHGLESFEQEYRRAISMHVRRVPVKVLPLERIIASKRAANREKDRHALPRLLNTLKTQLSLQRKKP